MTLPVFNVVLARNSSVMCAHRSALRSCRTDAAARGRRQDRDGSIYSDAREFRSKWQPRHSHLKRPTGSAGCWSCWPWGAALADRERIGTGSDRSPLGSRVSRPRLVGDGWRLPRRAPASRQLAVRHAVVFFVAAFQTPVVLTLHDLF